MELCGSFLSGAWPARAGEEPPWISACGSRFAYPASFCVDLGFWRLLDVGRAPGVGACFSRPMLRWRFSWCFFFVSSVCICTFFSLFTVYLFGSCFKSGFFGLCGWSFFSFIHCIGLRACCLPSGSDFSFCSSVFALWLWPCCIPLWGFFFAMKDSEVCSKINK
jgi:hypothetical protein